MNNNKNIKGESFESVAGKNIDTASCSRAEQDAPPKKDEKLEALVQVAKAYFNRGTCVQYDQLFLNRSGSVREGRRQPGREPEYATAQSPLHLDCSSFVWSVYYQTFGIKLSSILTEGLINLEDIRVFYHECRDDETPEMKKEVLAEFKKTLRPGDAVVTRIKSEENGHIMLYIGDGKVLHCSGRDYNYKEKCDAYELRGGILEFLEETFYNEGAFRYLFADRISRFAILRPYTEESRLTPAAKARLRGLRDIAVFKTCSHAGSHWAAAGERVRYDFLVKNVSQELKKIKITDGVPEGAEGEPFSCEFYLMPLESRLVSRYVTAKNSGMIVSACTRVNGFKINTIETVVGKTLTEEQKSSIAAAAKATRARGWKYAKTVYRKALDMELPFGDTDEMMGAYIEPSDVDTLVRLKSFDMLVPGFYGGKNMQTAKGLHLLRMREVRPGDFETGDILVYADEKDVNVLVCTGEYAFSGEHGSITGADAYKIIDSLMGQFMFFVLRPSKNM